MLGSLRHELMQRPMQDARANPQSKCWSGLFPKRWALDTLWSGKEEVVLMPLTQALLVMVHGKLAHSQLRRW